MATQIGKAYVQIVPSAKGLGKSISDMIESPAKESGASAGLGMGKKLVGALVGVFAAAKVGEAIKNTIMEGGALEQSIGGIKTLFAGSAEKVIATANNAYKTCGMSANQYMEMTTGFAASLLSSVAKDTNKAADIADMAMTDMADNANKMGTNMEDIKNAYQGFAKQNYTMLDNLKLGYGGTRSEMERLLANATKVTGIKYDINNLADVYSAIHVIQDELGITGATALEASTTLQGSFSAMSAAAKNVMGNLTLGQDIKPALNGLAETTVTFLVGNLLPAIWNILRALPGALFIFVQAIGQQLQSSLLSSGGELLTSLSTGIKNGLAWLSSTGVEIILALVQGIVTGLPELLLSMSELINGMNDSISAMLPNMLTKGTEIINTLVSGIIQNIPAILTGMAAVIDSLLNMIISNLPNVFNAGVSIISNLFTSLMAGLPQIVSTAATLLQGFVSKISSLLPNVLRSGVDMLLNLVNGIINNLPQIVSSALRLISSFLQTIGQNLPSILQTGIEMLGRLAAGLIRAIPNLIGQLPAIVSAIINFFTSTDWWSIGSNIISGIARGLAGAGGQLWDAVKGLLGSFKDQVLSFFGIHSPSRWGQYVGEMIDAGIAGGLSGNSGMIERSLNHVTAAAESGALMAVQYRPSPIMRNRQDETQEMMGKILTMLRRLVEKEGDVVMYLNEREIGRANFGGVY